MTTSMSEPDGKGWVHPIDKVYTFGGKSITKDQYERIGQILMEKPPTVVVEITVEINQKYLDKMNEAAEKQGRATRTGSDYVESAVSDALKFNFITQNFTTRVK